MKKLDVIGLGALNVDRIYKVENIVDDGESVINESRQSPGGSAANTVYGLARLGLNTGFAGVIGDDAEGKLVIKDFEKAGVDTDRIKIKSRARTGMALCLSDNTGKRSLYVMPGVNNSLNSDDLDLEYINNVKIIHISSFTGKKQLGVVRRLVTGIGPSVRVSFSPGALFVANGLTALKPILKKTYILFINQSEIKQLTGMDFIAGAKACLKLGCKIVVVTLGKGATYKLLSATSFVTDGKNDYIVESPSLDPESVVDTTGAGDAFAAGFLYGLLSGRGLEECGRLGDIVAQFSITAIGARAGLPTLKELSECYQSLYTG